MAYLAALFTVATSPAALIGAAILVVLYAVTAAQESAHVHQFTRHPSGVYGCSCGVYR